MFFKEERHAVGSKIEALLYRFLQYRPISKCYNKGVDKIEVGYQSKASEFMKFRRLFAVLEKRNAAYKSIRFLEKRKRAKR